MARGCHEGKRPEQCSDIPGGNEERPECAYVELCRRQRVYSVYCIPVTVHVVERPVSLLSIPVVCESEGQWGTSPTSVLAYYERVVL